MCEAEGATEKKTATYNCLQLPFGFGIAVAVRVGNELGAGNPLAAKRAAFTGVIIEFIIAVAIVIFILSTRNVIGRIFTDDE